jgi:hypothetical protein
MEGLVMTEEDLMNQLPSERNHENEREDFFQNNEFTLRRLSGQILEKLAKFFNY